jgi:hypothetical protein
MSSIVKLVESEADIDSAWINGKTYSYPLLMLISPRPK